MEERACTSSRPIARSTWLGRPEPLAQATVTLTDYGPGSALFGVPLVLPGQALALRVGAVEQRLVARENGAFALAPTAYLCASVDHRALDGVDAGTVLAEMKRVLQG